LQDYAPDAESRSQRRGESRIPLLYRLHELPRDKEIATFCRISLRGYEAALILEATGSENVRVTESDIAMWPYEKVQ